MEGPIHFSIFLFGVSFGLYWFVLVCFEPKGPHGRGPLGAQGTPWEGTLGSPRNPMGGDPWEPKGSHGRGPLGAQGIPWEGTLGSPLDSRVHRQMLKS